jgi:hypothetical protein
MTGRVTENFRGGGPNGAIIVEGVSFALSRPLELHSRLLQATSVCDGVDLRKPTDAATRALLESPLRSETIGRAKFRERGLTITPTDLTLASVRHVGAGTTGAYEAVPVAPSQVEFTCDATGDTAVHRFT